MSSKNSGRKRISMSKHASQRRAERGLRPCDIAKILKFGQWTQCDDGRYRVSLTSDLYVIVGSDRKTIVTVVNNRMLGTDDIYRIIGNTVRNMAEKDAHKYERDRMACRSFRVTDVTGAHSDYDYTMNRSRRRGELRRFMRDMYAGQAVKDFMDLVCESADNWKVS